MLILAGFFCGYLLVTNAAYPRVALGIKRPAIGRKGLRGYIQAVGVGVEALVEFFLGVLVHPHGQAIGAVHQGAEALCKGGGELRTVEQMRDSAAYGQELGGAEVRLEHQLAVAVALKAHGGKAALLFKVKRGIDVIAAGQLADQVDRAGLQGVKLGGLHSLYDDDLLNGRLLAFKVAGVVGVDLKNGFLGGRVKADQAVGAGGNAAFREETGSFNLGRDRFRAHVAVDVSAVAVILHAVAFTQPHINAQGGQGGVAQVIEVRNLVSDYLKGVGVVVQQTGAGIFLGKLGRCAFGCAFRDHALGKSFAADIGEVTCALAAQALEGGVIKEQQRGQIVGSGDRRTIVEHEAFFDLHGEGLGAVFVDDGLDALSNGRVHDHGAALVK